jgi:hypothetical protein
VRSSRSDALLAVPESTRDRGQGCSRPRVRSDSITQRFDDGGRGRSRRIRQPRQASFERHRNPRTAEIRLILRPCASHRSGPSRPEGEPFLITVADGRYPASTTFTCFDRGQHVPLPSADAAVTALVEPGVAGLLAAYEQGWRSQSDIGRRACSRCRGAGAHQFHSPSSAIRLGTRGPGQRSRPAPPQQPYRRRAPG